MTLRVNEKSPIFFTIKFEDEVGDPLIPSTVEWRLDDRTNGVELVAWTTIPSPAATMNFTVPGDNNLIADEDNIREEQIFGIRVDDSLPGEGHQQFSYQVMNLRGPTGA